VNKFSEWIIVSDKKQTGVAEKIGISTSSLHDILRKGQMPSLRVAYEIEKYTRGAITVYDWIDEKHIESKTDKKIKKKINNKSMSIK